MTMVWSGGRVAAPYAGRLIAHRLGALDLATGLAASVRTMPVPPGRVRDWIAPPRVGGVGVCGHAAPAPAMCVDAWLTQDALGAWRATEVWIDGASHQWARASARAAPVPGNFEATLAHAVVSDDVGAWPSPLDTAAWLAIAALARAQGATPIHASALTYLSRADASGWPPLLVGVPASLSGCPLTWDRLRQWVYDHGRIAGLVCLQAQAGPTMADLDGGTRTPQHYWRPAMAARLRRVRRAWRALARPGAPLVASARTPEPRWRTAMTHLEVLDVSAQLDEEREDDVAVRRGCALARRHARAIHVAVIASHAGEPVLRATDGTSPAPPQAWWALLCRDDGPAEVCSADGWHAAVRIGDEADTRGWLCGTYASAEERSRGRELLAVFARLLAERLRTPPVKATPAGDGDARLLLGDSRVMQAVRAQLVLAARAPFPVLIRGESGCGKELAARAIHGQSARRHRRCAAINCAALPDDLIESELFGHVRGAFTGASADRVGLFDDADGGTLFLDEVGELGVRAQAKLLRVLQDGEVRRVGENRARRVDVRVIAATNVALDDAVRRGAFRADLYYRLDVVRITMPPLRERREDIAPLAAHFWRECTARVGSRARLDGRTLRLLERYDWPGNVRELQNALAALAVRVPPRARVVPDDLPPEVRRADECHDYGRAGLGAARRQFEATFVREALTRAGGRPGAAARDLGLTRQGLVKLVRRLGIAGP